MTNREIEEKLQTAVNHAVPDVWGKILSDCDKRGELIVMDQNTTKKNTRFLPYIGGIAAALILVAGVAVFGIVSAGNRIDSIVEIDVNPSIELQVNSKDRVLAASPLNDDAVKILDGMDLKNADMDVAVNAIVGSMLKNGYIDDLANSVLISVENQNTEKGDTLRQKLTEEFGAALEANALHGAILSQAVTATPEVKALAEKYHISSGKAQLISQIVGKNSTLQFADLTALTVNDLNLLANAQKTLPTGIATAGTPSNKGYVGEEKALQAVLAGMNLQMNGIQNPTVSFDFENGKMVYEVKFQVGNKKYDVELDALTGIVTPQELAKAEREAAEEAAETAKDKLEDEADKKKDADEAAADKLEKEEEAKEDAAEKAKEQQKKEADIKEDAAEAAADKAKEEKEAAEDKAEAEREAAEDKAKEEAEAEKEAADDRAEEEAEAEKEAAEDKAEEEAEKAEEQEVELAEPPEAEEIELAESEEPEEIELAETPDGDDGDTQNEQDDPIED